MAKIHDPISENWDDPGNRNVNDSQPGGHLPSITRNEFLDMMRGLAVCAVLPESFVFMLKHSANMASSEEPLGTGECYKRSFNTLNYQIAHFPPPEHPNDWSISISTWPCLSTC